MVTVPQSQSGKNDVFATWAFRQRDDQGIPLSRADGKDGKR